ncbi:uncharacterized protein LOC135817549 [Sycon ciliatum]|uniref:uncharacterized protein LOC135817549 n=1 Tax=Sycon ciliatum TaxID=27933 RepID=UPI0031F6CCB1|eukprot:scpid98371/ scgid1767/ Transmembrane protein 50A; Small membrane protein 1
MSGCLDDCTCRSCCCCGCCDPLCDKLEEIDWSMKRNALASIAAGVLFFSGWWVMIDMAAVSTTTNAYFAIGVGSTLAFFMINAVSASQLDNDFYQQGCLSGHLARLWLFVGFLLAFSSLVGCSAVLYIEVDQHANLPAVGPTSVPTGPTTVPATNMTSNTSTVWMMSTAPTTLTASSASGSVTSGNATTTVPPIPLTKFERLWPGVAIFLQNFLIFCASMVFKFGRSEDLY